MCQETRSLVESLTYQQWIKDNVSGDGYGQCNIITLQMAKAFPELIRVRGHYYCMIWGERTHWWLITWDGEIIDPTAAQFPSKGAGVYVPWGEDEKEPTGRCLNCGDLVYTGGVFCSDNCEIETRCHMGV